jgi:hypothetical protein
MEIARLYDSVKINRLLRQTPHEEFINFTSRYEEHGSLQMIRHRQMLQGSFDSTKLNNAIVLMSYFGNENGEVDNSLLFFSPLNNKPLGRANPDMFWGLIHANIITMILDENYIYVLSIFEEFVIAIIASFLHIMVLMWIHERFPKIAEPMAIALVILQLTIFAMLRYYLFLFFDIKATLTFTLASLVIAGILVGLYMNVWPYFKEKASVPEDGTKTTAQKWLKAIWTINVLLFGFITWIVAGLNTREWLSVGVSLIVLSYFLIWFYFRWRNKPEANSIALIFYSMTIALCCLFILFPG